MVFLKKRSYTGDVMISVTSPKIPSPGEKELPQLCGSSFVAVVRPAAHVPNRWKSGICPAAGKIQPKTKVSIMRWNLKEAGGKPPA